MDGRVGPVGRDDGWAHELADDSIKPLAFGGISIWPPVISAPMAGYTGGVYREILREHGCPFCVTEMVSAKGLILGGDDSSEILFHTPKDRPLAVQLFGYDPEDMARAAEKLQSGDWQILGQAEGESGTSTGAPKGSTSDSGFDCIDINMGCPARKITSQGSGAALLKDIGRAVAIVEAVKSVSRLPVSAKARIGWSDSRYVADLASKLEEAGLDMLVIHGRTAEQGYSGKADWKAVERAAKSVSIPVVGNGDVSSAAIALEKISQGIVSGVMVGRAMLGNPVFFEDLERLLNGDVPVGYTAERKMALAADHFKRSVQRYGEVRGVLDMRKQLCFYFRGIEGAARLRERLMAEKSPYRILEILKNACPCHHRA